MIFYYFYYPGRLIIDLSYVFFKVADDFAHHARSISMRTGIVAASL